MESLRVSRQQSLYSRASVLLCGLIVVCELIKLSGTYAIRYKNHGEFPMNPSMFVILLETSKAIVCAMVHRILQPEAPSPLEHFNIHLLWPSLGYAISNNVFLLAMSFVSPAVWMILVQIRIPLTLLIYKIFLNRVIHITQWTAALLLCLAIALSQLPDLQVQTSSAFSIGFVLAILSSLLGSAAGVYTEVLFKNPRNASIWQQQCQMYLGGAAFAILPFVFSYGYLRKDLISSAPSSVWFLLFISWASSAVHGISIAVLVKRLDNVVKYHLSSAVHLLNSGINHVLFPDKFNLSMHFVLSLLLVIYAIRIYENKTFAPSCRRTSCQSITPKHQLL